MGGAERVKRKWCRLSVGVSLQFIHFNCSALLPIYLNGIERAVSRTSAQCHQSARSPRDRAIRGQVEPQSQLYLRQVERAGLRGRGPALGSV
jgi:hypothetical protein